MGCAVAGPLTSALTERSERTLRMFVFLLLYTTLGLKTLNVFLAWFCGLQRPLCAEGDGIISKFNNKMETKSLKNNDSSLDTHVIVHPVNGASE